MAIKLIEQTDDNAKIRQTPTSAGVGYHASDDILKANIAGSAVALADRGTVAISSPDGETVRVGATGLEVVPGSLTSAKFDAADGDLVDDDGNTLTFVNGVLTTVTPA